MDKSFFFIFLQHTSQRPSEHVKLPVVVNDGVDNVYEIASEHNVADMDGELPPPQVALRRRFYN